MIYDLTDEWSYTAWMEHENSCSLSIESILQPTDKYEIANFARDDFERFSELVSHLSPRDQEIMYCFAVLQKRPTDLSRLFGKAGHRAEEDLHKAAHKLAGLIAFGAIPDIVRIGEILRRRDLEAWGGVSFSLSLWQYARSRDFTELGRLVGKRGLRQQMLRAFKILHSAEGREEGLLAGWILWLVDGSDPNGKGWLRRKRIGREHRLGPTSFSMMKASIADFTPRATGRGGRGQRPDVVRITRRMKFMLRGMNDGR